jgi:hypothetical protein
MITQSRYRHAFKQHFSAALIFLNGLEASKQTAEVFFSSPEFPRIDINRRLHSSKLPIQLADINIETIKFLVSRGADPSAKGNWALTNAMERNAADVVSFLVNDKRVRDRGIPKWVVDYCTFNYIAIPQD